MERVPRPRLHFTPRAGRVGDLFGVLTAAGSYQVFYQHLSDGVPAWGRATSDDLIIWTEQEVSPPAGDGSARCGTVVVGPDGPVLFHVLSGGRVARAAADPGHTGWRSDPSGPLLGGPPSGVTGMSDPYVWWAGGNWRMLLSATLRGGTAGVLQYHSADLLNWSYDGVIVFRDRTSWGCPRLFPLDGSWVLVLTSGDEIVYGIGNYDGMHFTARAWGTFGRGGIGAIVTFVDAAGRRCAVARLGAEWGTLSLPWVLSVRDDRLIATPHPNLDPYLINGAAGLTAAGGEVRDHGDLILTMPAGGETTLFADADIVEVTVEGVSGLGAARRTGPTSPGVRFARFGAAPEGHFDLGRQERPDLS
ncbi:glycoside hydrolase family 32 protein [Actinoplanes xinjiangensis]|uniref:glycoside hydrolase family 32 protein n=1 Tax=Actinoplanes xinjiangensis TaxID=512350 RepID=UPI000D6CE1AA|nr:glycoside hydrolase family 32 protein [Actinoplanes xinjiangensis]